MIRPPVYDSLQGHIYIDNFQFSPITTQSPIGNLDGVANSQGAAVGWSLDPDNQSASNNVECRIDGNSIGVIAANNSSPDLSYPGNHRFSFPIPIQYRDGNQHQISCYGLDVTGGDPAKLLGGSPHTFKFNAPIGYLDGIDADGYAYGWSQDPDVPAQSNRVQFHIDGALVGETIANIPGPGVSPGDHAFKYSIPAQYRDNRQHTIAAYGIDLTGDHYRQLTGSPKTFTLSPNVQSVRFESITNETIDNELTSSEIEKSRYGFPSLRIFAEAKFPGDTVNHKRVRVRASVGTPNITVYFKNYDVDDPSNDPIIDDTGDLGNDNHKGRTVGGPYPPFASGTLSGTSATTDANGDAIVYFTVTDSPGDNFRIAASTNLEYLNGVKVAGTGLADAANVSLTNTGKAKQTELLTVWRKVHLEVDSMGEVLGNAVNGTFPNKTPIYVGDQSVWVPIYASKDTRILDEGRYRGTQRPDGTWRLYGGNLSIGFGTSSLRVLDNDAKGVWVKSDSGIVEVQPGQVFALFDDDDYNSDDGLLMNGDNQEDVDFRYNYQMAYCLGGNETLSRLCPTGDVERNPFAAAYIEPEYEWARSIQGMNDTDATFRIEIVHDRLGASSGVERDTVNEKRDSDGMESNDFWIGHLLLAYQSNFNYDPPADGAVFGIAPASVQFPQISFTNSANSFSDVPPGGIGAMIYLEVMRDADITDGANVRQKAAPHELGHQFGLAGDDSDYIPGVTTWGLMGYENTFDLNFVPHHIKILRFRTSSPGK